MTPSTQSAARERARRRVIELQHLYVHALAFVLGNTVAFVVNWITLSGGDNRWWFQWGLLVWGTALAAHAFTLLGRGAFLGASWEQRKIGEYLGRERGEAEARPGEQP